MVLTQAKNVRDRLQLTLSPHTVLRNHVLRVWNVVARARHVAVLLMVRKNLVFCTMEPKPRSGTWKRMLEDLKRKGIGGVLEAVYATTLLYWSVEG